MSSKQIVGYVVREGQKRGKGRYIGPDPGPDWSGTLTEAFVWRATQEASLRYYARAHGGRVVRIVRRSREDAIAAAERRGYARAIDDAAKVCQSASEIAKGSGHGVAEANYSFAADCIRALAPRAEKEDCGE